MKKIIFIWKILSFLIFFPGLLHSATYGTIQGTQTFTGGNSFRGPTTFYGTVNITTGSAASSNLAVLPATQTFTGGNTFNSWTTHAGTATFNGITSVTAGAGTAGPRLQVSTGTSKLFEVNGSSVVSNVPFYPTGIIYPSGSAPFLSNVPANPTNTGGAFYIFVTTGNIGANTFVVQGVPSPCTRLFSPPIAAELNNTALTTLGIMMGSTTVNANTYTVYNKDNTNTRGFVSQGICY